jgi:hypothetical protein
MVNVRIQKYDPERKVAPFRFVTLVPCVEFNDTTKQEDPDGSIRYGRLKDLCGVYRLTMRFLSLSHAPGIKYDVTVRGELESLMDI